MSDLSKTVPPVSSSEGWAVPELGPSLGRLADPPTNAPLPGSLSLNLEDIRLELVTRIFDVAGAARSFMAAGDHQSAVSSLGRVAWLELWERAVAAVSERLAQAVNARLDAAAAESRIPEKRLAEVRLQAAEVHAIEARLGSSGATFVSALDALEQIVPAAASAGPRGRLVQDEWQLALATAARRLEAGWMLLIEAVRREQDRWQREIERVRSWRRPRWPLWTLTLVVVLIAMYLGLVLGGYLPVPGPLRGLAELWWSQL